MKKTIVLFVFVMSMMACNKAPKEVALSSADFQVTQVNDMDVTAHDVSLNINLENKRISGKCCNGFGGTLSIGDNKKTISIKEIISTQMYCEETMKIENTLLDNLKAATTYTFDGTKLQLEDGQGKVLVKAITTEKEE